MIEFDSYITPDGREYILHDEGIRWVMSIEGTGMPSINYITQQGPFQHGSTLLDYRLQPRVVQMVIRHNYIGRQQLYSGRQQLLDAIRPNRQVPGQLRTGVLRKYFSGKAALDLDVMVEQGPNFQPREFDKWDEWSLQEVIRFIAFNPIFYNSAIETHDFINTDTTPGEGGSGDDPNLTQLVFPISFPIHFNRNIGAPGGGGGEGGGADPQVIDYIGTWFEYPTIILTGPLGSPIIIENTTTGEMLRLNYDIQPGETVTIALTYGIKTVISSTMGNVIGFLDPLSDLGSFHLEPGTNNFVTSIVGQDSNSVVQFQYKNRYIGY